MTEGLGSERGGLLVAWARHAVAEAVGVQNERPAERPEWLDRPGATFVTLQENGRLRGCIGTFRAWRPLLEDLRANARAAATGDPRFEPLSAEAFDRVAVEVSLLSPLERLAVASESELAATLRPHVDGALLELGGRRGTFLPQVWRHYPEPTEFVRQLKRKAGIDGRAWSEEIVCWRYTVEQFV